MPEGWARDVAVEELNKIGVSGIWHCYLACLPNGSSDLGLDSVALLASPSP